MKNKLLNYYISNDYGKQYAFELFNYQLKKYKWSLLQFSLCWSNYNEPFPYLSIAIQKHPFFTLAFFFLKFEFSLEIISRTWSEYHE